MGQELYALSRRPLRSSGDLSALLVQWNLAAALISLMCTQFSTITGLCSSKPHDNRCAVPTVVKAGTRRMFGPWSLISACSLSRTWTSNGNVDSKHLFSVSFCSFLFSTETACQATSLRKNRDRTETSARVMSGGRLDGVVCTYEEDPYEFAGVEIARTFHGGTKSTKWLRDSRKLTRALRDMFHRLHHRV
jgi:hypothetical protein